jgi:hypothetical protein
MYLIGVLMLLLGGVAGTYFGFVDDREWLVLLGQLSVAAAVISMFGGRLLPTMSGPNIEVPQWARETIFAGGVVVVLFAGTAATVLAFTEDAKWSFALGQLLIVVALLSSFRGHWPSLAEVGLGEFALHEEDGALVQQRTERDNRVKEARFAGGIVVALLAGTVGTFLAFSEDSKLFFLIGQGIVVIAVLSMFYGRIPGLRKANR